MEEASNINLVEKEPNNARRRSITQNIIRAPLSLMPREEENGLPDFRINSCYVHSSGALLLDDKTLLDDTFQTVPNPNSLQQRRLSFIEQSRRTSFVKPMEIVNPDISANKLPAMITTTNEEDDDDQMGDGALDEDEDDIPGLTLPKLTELASVITNPQIINTSLHINGEKDIRSVQNKRLSIALPPLPTINDEDDDLCDPWEAVDPHIPSGVTKPLSKKKKSFQITTWYRRC